MGEGFTSSIQHILASLERVELLVQAAVWRARRTAAGDERFQGLYLSEQEIEALLARPAGRPRWADVPPPAALEAIASGIKERAAGSSVPLRLVRLAELFRLTPFDVDALLVCLAPEIDPRYERLYAYLQDDVTRKRPSLDLVLNLLCGDKLASRPRFAHDAPLLRNALLEFVDDSALRMDEGITAYLLECGELDRRLAPYARLREPAASQEDLALPPQAGFVFYLHGPDGIRKRSAAEGVCRRLDRKLLEVDGEGAAALDDNAFAQFAARLAREARLRQAAVYWEGFDALLPEQRKRRKLWESLWESGAPVFLSGLNPWEPDGLAQDRMFVRLEFGRPSWQERITLWSGALERSGVRGDGLDLAGVAGRFRLTAGQIQDAVASAASVARWRDSQQPVITAADLESACRARSAGKISALARKIVPRYGWGDIVLPPDRMEQLHEIRNYLRYRSRVYEEWGFDRKLALGKGLNVLFAGPSGTGKTMAAEVIAGELRLDLYKIDLAAVVSKYIGETEKNLSRIFDEAETSNAILFFDEADALFGKRSEVRDAHDRYANIEIGYLLQRMEEYEGVVILATNFRKNMDDAFVRRLHFTVEFPVPGAVERRRIWDQIFPEPAPLQDLDLEFMARRFEITGGSIRNIALSAAFLAADEGGAVTMNHLVRATRREYQNMGKVILDTDFA